MDTDDVLALVGAFVVFAALVLVTPIAMAFLGGFGAMVCGWVFEDTIRSVWRAMGVNLDRFSMFQIGAALAFAGSFIKSSFSSSKSDK